MKRLVLAVALVLLSGCSAIGGVQPTATETRAQETTVTRGYIVSTSTAKAPPEGATVTDYNSSQLEGATHVKRLLEETHKEGPVWRDITDDKFEAIESELAEVPRHDGAEFGYYFEYRGTIIQLKTLVEE